MVPRLTLGVLLASACMSPVASSRGTPLPGVTVSPVTAASIEIVDRTNAERRSLGLFELRRSDVLMRAAQLQADQMAEQKRMDHELPSARFPTPEDRLTAVGYRWSASGENVAEGYPSPSAVVAGWMKSPGHRENITSTHFTEMGAGIATGANKRTYYVQVFASPH